MTEHLHNQACLHTTAAGLTSIRCEHTEPPAVDRESLFSAMTTMCKVLGMDQVTAESVAVEHIGMWFNEGILLDAAAVRHEHGERIAKALDELSAKQPGAHAGWHWLETAYKHSAETARDLSPAPACPRCGHQHDPARPSQCVIPAQKLP